ETDGRLPSGQPLLEAMREVDEEASGGPAYFMINCAHPEHFLPYLQDNLDAAKRIVGVRANASRLSHAELDEAETLDEGDPVELAGLHVELQAHLPNLRVFGGCCGTDHRHIEAIAGACLGCCAAA
ncbi:MAG: homocysteine S-methyltransferase family protein, partial [Verrucomicrobiota bacterium]